MLMARNHALSGLSREQAQERCATVKKIATTFQKIHKTLGSFTTGNSSCYYDYKTTSNYRQDAQLSQKDRAAGCVIVLAKS